MTHKIRKVFIGTETEFNSFSARNSDLNFREISNAKVLLHNTPDGDCVFIVVDETTLNQTLPFIGLE